ncbi:Zinc finger MYM-type protein 1 [Eumeta japonica]|uniref:Zinc finger MYM-type protein 1 n=1 Tax=Eumeta variegata TaxID=151549 RepID=A0A4C1TRZ7_EUMVA|nr:Zinc finger MYM-type protein 1 [Eumeta japonica]
MSMQPGDTRLMSRAVLSIRHCRQLPRGPATFRGPELQEKKWTMLLKQNKMSEVPVKKKHQSGSEKRKKRQEQQNKLNEQLKKTQNLFKLGFSCESKEHQLHDSLSTCSASHTMAADPIEVPCEPFEQIGQDQETPKLVGAEESEAETEVIHQNVVHLELTVVLRYVTSNGEVAERFLKFLLIQNHKGEELATEILIFLSQYNIDVRNLRGQSYDNASNMPGCYNGLQAHIKRINHLAHYVPCAAHSLNLVGVRAAESCVGAISFFSLYRHYTTFFGINSSVGNYAQTSRKGDERKQDSSLVLKRVSDTRWCARADATKALANGYNSFQKALQSIAGDETQTSQAIHEAKCLLNDLGKMKML